MALEPVDLYVDLDALHELGGEIQSLITALAGAACRPAADPALLGGEDVAGAVDRFSGRWDDGRQRIADKLRDCLTYIELAISGYEQTEYELRSAHSPPRPPILADLDPGRRP